MSEEIAKVQNYRLEIRKDRLDNPESILWMTVTLPNGLRAKFGRCTTWDQSAKGFGGENCPPPESMSLTC